AQRARRPRPAVQVPLLCAVQALRRDPRQRQGARRTAEGRRGIRAAGEQPVTTEAAVGSIRGEAIEAMNWGECTGDVGWAGTAAVADATVARADDDAVRLRADRGRSGDRGGDAG